LGQTLAGQRGPKIRDELLRGALAVRLLRGALAVRKEGCAIMQQS
jgi:hypothetical protein